MNWYRKIIISSIVKTSSPKFFAEKLERFYELEYKYAMLRLRPFNGLEQRRENILKRFSDELNNMIPQIVQPIIETFQEWLRGHALLDPKTWATARATHAKGEDVALDWPIGEAYHYNVDIVQQATNDPEKYKNLTTIGRELIKEQIEQEVPEMPDIYEDELEDLNPKQQEKFLEDKEAELLSEVEEMTLYDILERYGNAITNDGLKEFLTGIEYYYLDIDPYDVIVELYMAVFDGWYKYWAARGIDQTRENVEISTSRLLSLSADTEPSVAIEAVTLALQTAHQSGQMMEYLEMHIDQHGFSFDGEMPEHEDANISQTFDDLADMNTSIWDEELREIGVQI